MQLVNHHLCVRLCDFCPLHRMGWRIPFKADVQLTLFISFHFIFPWRIGLLRDLVCLLVGFMRTIVSRFGPLPRLVLGRLRLLLIFVRLDASLATRHP